ncbi:MAG TPA: bifunctional 4-hydroxy-2-oxoglutarate aldolase/2-dehydro-3-deoxy-phosphogluconate aldolase [Ktedonobacterales bacterium]|jgi:2-dehydro-3-deoxyphosphogluconate aldolase/(4S)-4-hydroxy-2-oxoglutarate aldolase|nr:bifunctional 4-hydroxy-2-oxoglutarate aldolase/2-dehydro-3-deoxy-phosphogluconate aldolase [Ktedonobacterales bacterium]
MIPREVMSMMARRRLVAEVRTETAIQALSVVDALGAGGVTTIEVSLTIPGAQEILTHMATRQDVLVGAGAVLDARQASEAIACGARFIASPISNPELVPVCRDANVACILGGMTPTEIIAAQRAGAEMVKLFPAEALGGPQYIRAMLRQLTHMSLQISGNFYPEQLGEYLELPVRTIALGSLLVPQILVERSSWQAISNRARMFVDFVLNPHEYAARFLQMMGMAQPRPNPAVAAIPTMPIGENAVAAAMQPAPAAARSQPGTAADTTDEFKPWDSRPIDLGDEEDWLR